MGNPRMEYWLLLVIRCGEKASTPWLRSVDSTGRISALFC